MKASHAIGLTIFEVGSWTLISCFKDEHRMWKTELVLIEVLKPSAQQMNPSFAMLAS
jgi:hypothetical protein